MTRQVRYDYRLRHEPSRVGVRDNKQVICSSCGHIWSVQNRYCMWPIRLRLQRKRRWWTWPLPWRAGYSWHGWWVGQDGPSQQVFGWALHIGPVLILFGPLLKLRRKP